MDQKTTYSYQRTPGLDCPKCGVYFPTTIPDLLSGSIRCPYCGLTLYIDRKESGHAMQALENFQNALDKQLPPSPCHEETVDYPVRRAVHGSARPCLRRRCGSGNPASLPPPWQEVKKQIADDGKTIRVRDGIQALELLAELGISSVPADGVRLSRGSLTIVVTRGKKEDGIFYVLAVKEEGGASLEVKMVPPS